jgi:hypothetical protein
MTSIGMGDSIVINPVNTRLIQRRGWGVYFSKAQDG